MEGDRRNCHKPVTDGAETLLNESQLEALRQIQRFGWELQFIRRPLFQQPVAVVFCADGEKMGVLKEDGTVNMYPNMELRCSNLTSGGSVRGTETYCKQCGFSNRIITDWVEDKHDLD